MKRAQDWQDARQVKAFAWKPGDLIKTEDQYHERRASCFLSSTYVHNLYSTFPVHVQAKIFF